MTIKAIIVATATANTAFWGGTGVEMTMTGGTHHVATVACQNRMTSGHDTTTTATICADGLCLDVIVRHGLGDTPDSFEITPPDGFVAVPPRLDLNENASGQVLIFRLDGGMS